MMRKVATSLCLLTLLVACKTQYVEVEKPVVVEHSTTHHHTDIVRDTLLQRDSVYHYVQGDTTIIEKWHTTHHFNKVIITDTLHDTIPVTKEVQTIKEVERSLTRWERTKMDMGGIAIGVALAAIIALIAWAVIKMRSMTK